MINAPSNPCFTARQISHALGCKRQAIAQRLASVTDWTEIVVSGNPARAWKLSSLPVALQCELSAAAARRGFADARAMLNDSQATQPIWFPRAPLAQIEQGAWDKACKLQAVLEPFLISGERQQRSQAGLEAAGIASYEKTFGHRVSGRWFRALLNRTIERDGGLNNFSRLKLYLDEDAGAKPKPARKAIAALPESLADTVKTLDNPAAPTPRDKKFLFDAVFRHLEGSEAGDSLIDSLFAAVPALARTKKALRKQFKRKHAAWLEAGGNPAALEDRRWRSGNWRKPDFTADEEKIRNEAILHDGSESLAHRKLRERGELSTEFVNYYQFNPRQNKSHVPATVRENITRQVDMCAPIHHGPWAARMAGPYIPRDWSGVQPGDWFSGDDVTWNNYFYFYDDAGQLHIERGECLVLHDLRTGYVMDYVLIAGKYNSRHIRKLILAVHDKHGLPFHGFYFERGVWKARIIQDLDAKTNFHWRETESGLAAFNLQVRHATTPRAKPIEGLFRILQDRQRSEPGFVGNNERMDERERMQDFLARARRGMARPEEKLLSMEQWAARLDEIFSTYNADPQNGKMLDGSSPAEAWQAGLDRRVPCRLPDDARYLLATHCTRVKVRQQGIILTIGGNKMLFCNERTGQLIGQDAIAFYNLDCPELLTVSDLNRQNYFTVKNISLPAMSATKEQFKEVHTAIAGHRKAAKTIYGSINHPAVATITRDNDASEEVKELGRFVSEEVEQFEQAQSATRRTLRKIQTAAAAGGIEIDSNIRHPDRVLEGVELLRQAREENASGADPGPKTFVLKPSPAAPPSAGLYWRLSAQCEKIKGKQWSVLRHQLTAKHLGGHPKVSDMTPAQLAKMIDVFSALVRDSQPAPK